MIVTCPKCQKKYRIDQSRYHEGIKFLRCQTCGETFRFNPPPPETPPTESRLLELECHGCKKKYVLDKNMLTPEMTTIPCKTCGLYIPIEMETGVDLPKETGQETEDVIEPEILSWSSPSNGQSETPHRQKKAMNFVVGAIIFLLIIAGAYLGYILFFKKEESPPKLIQSPTKIPEAMLETGTQPLIYMDINLAILRKLAEYYIPAENKDFGYQIASALYDSLHPERGHLFLYPDPKYQFLPVLLVQSKRHAGLKEALIKKGILNQFLEPSEKGTYKIKPTAFAAVAKSDFPIDLYRIRLFEKSVVFGPTTLSKIWKEGDKALLSYRLVRFADLVRKPAGLAVMSFLTEDIQEGWEKSITQSLAQNPDPQVAKIAGIVGNFLSHLTKPFKQINFLAIGLKFSADKKRILSYAQEFRRGINGASVYKQIKTGTWEDPETEGLVLNLTELLNDERLENNISFEKNRLSIDLTWSAEDDDSIYRILTEATIGYLFAQSMGSGEPTSGPIEIRYETAPKLVARVDTAKIKGKIHAAVKNSLFPGHYWRMGNNPRMMLEFDPIDLPNAVLAELNYEILSIGVPGEKNVLRKAYNPVKQASGSFISLPVVKGIRAEDLGKVRIHFNMALPVKLHTFKFRSNAVKGSAKKAGSLSVKLNQLERDVASVTFRGGKSCHLYAFDKTGRALAALESMGSSTSKFSRFQGIIDTLEVVVVTEVLEDAFEVEVDLNNGKELQLPAKPNDSVPVRRDRREPLTYAELTQQDLQKVTVKWDPSKNLSLTMPKSPIYGDAQWEAHFFDTNKPALHAWDPTQMGEKFVLYFRKPLAKIPDAAFGKVRLKLSTGIHRMTFSKKTASNRTVKRLPSGQKVVVSFDKNQITYSAGQNKILQIVAYDTVGKRLQRGKYARTSKSGQVRRFWGQPTTFVLDIATQEIAKIIDFDLKNAPTDRAAYKTYKQKIDHQRIIFNALKAIERARRKHHSGYGETLAGLYYIYYKKQPLMLIDQAIAHSDPAGKSRYGYKLKPYKGYHFSYLAGTEQNGIKSDYQRNSQEKIFSWQKGSFKAMPYHQSPDIVARPVDNSQPTFVLLWDEVYLKYLKDPQLKYIPQNIHTSEWVKIRFIN
jgi:predicted Zn finger-like uncharacterized protein